MRWKKEVDELVDCLGLERKKLCSGPGDPLYL